MCYPVCLRSLLFAVCGIGPLTPAATAGWVCIKNESKVALVLHEVATRPTLKRGKTIKLLPGEVYREHRPSAGEREVRVYDSRNPVKPLCSAKLVWPAKGDVVYKLEVVDQVVRLAPVVTGKGPVQPVVQVGSAKPTEPPKR